MKKENKNELIKFYCKAIDKCNLLFKQPNNSCLGSKIKKLIEERYNITNENITFIKAKLVELATKNNWDDINNTNEYHLSSVDIQYILKFNKENSLYKNTLAIYL